MRGPFFCIKIDKKLKIRNIFIRKHRIAGVRIEVSLPKVLLVQLQVVDVPKEFNAITSENMHIIGVPEGLQVHPSELLAEGSPLRRSLVSVFDSMESKFRHGQIKLVYVCFEDSHHTMLS